MHCMTFYTIIVSYTYMYAIFSLWLSTLNISSLNGQNLNADASYLLNSCSYFPPCNGKPFLLHIQPHYHRETYLVADSSPWKGLPHYLSISWFLIKYIISQKSTLDQVYTTRPRWASSTDMVDSVDHNTKLMPQQRPAHRQKSMAVIKAHGHTLAPQSRLAGTDIRTCTRAPARKEKQNRNNSQILKLLTLQNICDEIIGIIKPFKHFLARAVQDKSYVYTLNVVTMDFWPVIL